MKIFALLAFCFFSFNAIAKKPAFPQKAPPLAEEVTGAQCDPGTSPCWVATDAENDFTKEKSENALEVLQAIFGEDIPIEFDLTRLYPTPKTLSQLIWHALHGRSAHDVAWEDSDPVQGWTQTNLQSLLLAATDRIYQCEQDKADAGAATVAATATDLATVITLAEELRTIVDSMND
jgi:hypothetical protein